MFVSIRTKILACALSMIFATLLCSAPAVAQVCDPYAADNQTARDAIRGVPRTNIPLAQSIVNKVLSATVNGKPNTENFSANFNAAMIVVATAGTSHKVYLDGVHKLEAAAALLQKQIAESHSDACAVKGDYYRIYNTIGAEYFNDGNIGKARDYYAISYKYLGKLSTDTRAGFLGNLGQLSYYLNNYSCAFQAYRDAAAIETKTVQKREDQQGIDKMTSILGPSGTGGSKCGDKDFFPPLFKEATIRNAGVADLGLPPGKGDQVFVACEIDAASPEDIVQFGYIDTRAKSPVFHPLIEVQKTLRYTCGKLVFSAGLGHVGARIKDFSSQPASVQVFKPANTSASHV